MRRAQYNGALRASASLGRNFPEVRGDFSATRALLESGRSGFVNRATLGDELLASLVERHVRARVQPPAFGLGPVHGVAQNLLNLRVMVGRVSLVTRSKVEDFAVAAPVTAAGA